MSFDYDNESCSDASMTIFFNHSDESIQSCHCESDHKLVTNQTFFRLGKNHVFLFLMSEICVGQVTQTELIGSSIIHIHLE